MWVVSHTNTYLNEKLKKKETFKKDKHLWQRSFFKIIFY